ncbi:single-strand DNA endonuclease ASTE1 [Symphorus nematophorus]
MGVRGLVTFVESHGRIYRDVRFRDSRLVIDGCNLLHLLYFDSGLDQNHGGEHAAFEDLIEKFITALRECGVAPYVVLDGGMDYTDKKMETIALRSEDRLKRAHEAAVGGRQEGLLPQLAKIVFNQTLARLEVPLAQCYAEADQEIAALAKEWQCPVLSIDSDFYIFDLPGGLLPLTHFKWKALEQSGSKSYIPCKKYNTSSFCIYFNIERQLLPTFAALAGNDYVNLQRMESHQPIKWAQFCPKSNVLDVLLLQRMSLTLAVEDAVRPSSYLISRPLRRVMYGLLLGKGKQLQVNECDRVGHQLTVIRVQPVFTQVTRQLTLDSLDKAEPSQRLQVLLEALGVTEASLSNLPPQLRLPLAVTCYWLQRAKPPRGERLLKALLLGLSNGDALRHRAALQSQHLNRKPVAAVTYAFNQWQTCLKASIHLNQLLGFPLPEPQIARLFEGTLVHHLVHRLGTGKLKLPLKFNQSGVRQYKTMLAVVRQFQAQEASTPSETQRTTAAPQQQRRCRRQPLDDLTAGLRQLFVLCDNDEDEEAEIEVSSALRAQEDLHLDDQLSVRTRYRSKERNNRCSNPELSRKQECRGALVR